MFINKWKTSTLLMAFVVLSCETSEIEEQLDTCVWVEVNLHQSQNSSETSCEAPKEPSNGGYVSDVIRERYNTGDTITYHCNTGHQLIGQVNRTCNGTSKQWEPDEPYCQPEYIGHLMQKLSGIEDQMRVIEQRITTVEANTLQIGRNMSALRSEVKAIDNSISATSRYDIKVSTTVNNVSAMDNNGSAMDNNVSAMDNNGSAIDNNLSTIDNNASTIYNISIMQSLRWQTDKKRLTVCTNVTEDIDEDTVSKCMTMQLGERNGQSVSVHTWVIENYMSKVNSSRWVPYNSTIFYHTVPGHKLRLRGYIDSDSEIRVYLSYVPGEYDDRSASSGSKNRELTVLTNVGTEVLHRSFSGEDSTCQFDQISPLIDMSCYRFGPNWYDVWSNKMHILNDGSVVIKLYIYN